MTLTEAITAIVDALADDDELCTRAQASDMIAAFSLDDDIKHDDVDRIIKNYWAVRSEG